MLKFIDDSPAMITETEDETTQLLKSARCLIEEGWMKDHYWDDEISPAHFCILGAIFWSAGFRPGRIHAGNPAVRLAEARLMAALGGSSAICISDFNDAPGTKKKDVLDLFDRALR